MKSDTAISKRLTIPQFLELYGAGPELVEIVSRLHRRRKLPHRTLGQFIKDGDRAIEEYAGIKGLTAKRLYELEDVMGGVRIVGTVRRWVRISRTEGPRREITQQRPTSKILDQSLPNYLWRSGCSDRLHSTLVRAHCEKRLPHSSVAEYEQDGSAAITRYRRIDGFGPKLLYELDDLLSETLSGQLTKAKGHRQREKKQVQPVPKQSGGRQKQSSRKTPTDLDESLGAFLGRMGCSDSLRRAINSAERQRNLPHRTMASFLRDSDRAIEQYASIPGFGPRVLYELDSLSAKVSKSAVGRRLLSVGSIVDSSAKKKPVARRKNGNNRQSSQQYLERGIVSVPLQLALVPDAIQELGGSTTLIDALRRLSADESIPHGSVMELLADPDAISAYSGQHGLGGRSLYEMDGLVAKLRELTIVTDDRLLSDEDVAGTLESFDGTT